jgi:hypothetical protein
MSSISNQIKLLANGIHPETGEVLPEDSLVHRADVIRTLFALSEELADHERPRAKKPKLSPEEKRAKNIAECRPPKSHFPWDEDEKQRLAAEHAAGRTLLQLSRTFERSTLAVAVQLQKLSLITDAELKQFGAQRVRPNPSLSPRPTTAGRLARAARWFMLHRAGKPSCLRGRG